MLSPRGVAPFTGAWIEITPPWVWLTREIVAPFTGAWIEITPPWVWLTREIVAPFTGAWIEIGTMLSAFQDYEKSHPSRVRGLK